MRIFLLKQVDDGGAYSDEYEEKVIRAKNENQAREIANENTGDERQIWDDKELVTCEIVTSSTGEIGVISDSFNAG